MCRINPSMLQDLQPWARTFGAGRSPTKNAPFTCRRKSAGEWRTAFPLVCEQISITDSSSWLVWSGTGGSPPEGLLTLNTG